MDPGVRSLAWKILYANHRPSLGPDAWRELVDEVGGPADVKGLPVDELLARAPFLGAVEALAEHLAGDPEEGRARVGRALAERWAGMYQRLVDHLEGRPEAMLELVAEELAPWFFEGIDLEVEAAGEGSARVRLDPAWPTNLQAGLLEGCLAQVAEGASVEQDNGRLVASWRAPAPERPHPVRVLAEATRARFLTATLVPVLVGTALAFADGPVAAGRALAALGSAAALHLAANLLDDVFDHRRGVDEANLTPTPFSGGSRVIQRGLLGSDRVLALAVGLGLAGAAGGAWLAAKAGVEVLALGLVGAGLGYAYSGDPFRLSHRGLGEAAVGLVFGPLIAGGAYAVQQGTLSGEALLAGVPVGLLMAGLLAVNELPDRRWDERTGKRTLVVRLGENAPVAIGAAFGLAYASLVGLVAGGLLAWPSLAALATVPLAVHVLRGVRRAGGDADELVAYQAAALGLHATTGLLVAAGAAVGGLL